MTTHLRRTNLQYHTDAFAKGTPLHAQVAADANRTPSPITLPRVTFLERPLAPWEQDSRSTAAKSSSTTSPPSHKAYLR